jgi:hypothetical protein
MGGLRRKAIPPGTYDEIVRPVGLTSAVAAVTLLVFPTGSASAYAYKTARGLYRDCSVAASGTGDAHARHQRCAEYLQQMLDAWNLDQAPGICALRTGEALPHADVKYWRARGLGLLSGEFRSAESSAVDFFNSQKHACPNTGEP